MAHRPHVWEFSSSGFQTTTLFRVAYGICLFLFPIALRFLTPGCILYAFAVIVFSIFTCLDIIAGCSKAGPFDGLKSREGMF